MAFDSIRSNATVILNTLRAINILGLLAAATACVLVIAKTTQLAVGWWFFDALSYVFTMGACFFLILSELPMIDRVRYYFEANWPLLSHHHGLSWLAVMMVLISAHVLSALYNPARKLEGHFRAAIIAGGIMVFASAFITFLASFFFRDRENNLNARTLRSKKAAASAAASLAGSVADSASIRGDWGMQQRERPAGFMGKLFGPKPGPTYPTYAGSLRRPHISGPIRDVEAAVEGGGYGGLGGVHPYGSHPSRTRSTRSATSRGRGSIAGPPAYTSNARNASPSGSTASSEYSSAPPVPKTAATTTTAKLPIPPTPAMHARSYAELERRPSHRAGGGGSGSSSSGGGGGDDDRRSPINPNVRRPETREHPMFAVRAREEEVKRQQSEMPGQDGKMF